MNENACSVSEVRIAFQTRKGGYINICLQQKRRKTMGFCTEFYVILIIEIRKGALYDYKGVLW